MKKIRIILSIICTITLIIYGAYVYSIGIIPNKYFIVLIAGLLLINILVILLAKHKVLSIVLLIISFIIEILSIYFLYKLSSTLDSINEYVEKDIYNIVVLKENDNNYKNIGILDSDSVNYNRVIEDINREKEYTYVKYSNVNDLYTALLNKIVDAILINVNNKILLDENMLGFKKNTRVIKDVSIDVVIKNEIDYKNKYGPFNILISGIDTRGNIKNRSRSDVNIVMSVNKDTNKVLLTTIPRDTYVRLHNTYGLKDKLTHAGNRGINMSRNTIEDFLDIEIPYYIRVNFTSVVKIIDTLGGVDIYNDVAFRGYNRYYKKGNIHLNGEEALEYARERHKMPNGDFTRGRHQMEIIKGIINKVSKSKKILLDYGKFMDILAGSIQTNIPDDTIKKYVKDQLDNMNSWDVSTYAIKGVGAYDYTYSVPYRKLYVVVPNENSINTAHENIEKILK